MTTKKVLIIFGLLAGFLGWLLGSFYYYFSHPKTFYHQSLASIGQRFPYLVPPARRSLRLTDSFFRLSLKTLESQNVTYLSSGQTKTIQRLTEKVQKKVAFSTEDARDFQSVKRLFQMDLTWIPKDKNGSPSWLEATALLQQVKKQARVIKIELEKEWVSVVVTINKSALGKQWEITFTNEVLYPVVIDSISLKAGGGSKFTLTDLATEKRRAEFELKDDQVVLADQFGLGLKPYALRGDVDQIVEFEMTLKNQMTGKVFEPRAIRFLDYTE